MELQHPAYYSDNRNHYYNDDQALSHLLDDEPLRLRLSRPSHGLDRVSVKPFHIDDSGRKFVKTEYIFVVGLPRTGTKLIMNVLAGSSRKIYISPETHFVGHLIRPGLRKKMRSIGDMAQDANVRKFVDLLYSDQVQDTYWKLLRNGHLGVDRESLLRDLLNSDRSDRGIFKALMQAPAQASESEILGEKSPAHLYHVPTLLEWFPNSKVIHTFRDPRAVLVSELEKRGKAKPTTLSAKLAQPFLPSITLMHMTVAWLYAVRLDAKYRKLYPKNYYLSKFEVLVTDPAKSVGQLCTFLEIEFRPEMLAPPMVDSSFKNTQRAASGFDKQALNRWKDHIKPWMNTWFLFWGKKPLREFGYVR